MMTTTFTPNDLESLREALLTWFDYHQRELPWRHDRDPYRIWVSEVMLQQTQVSTVIPYFERFLAQFPTIRRLAEAEESVVLRAWEGLGYYRRARHLHQAARQIVARWGDGIPLETADWAALPGIGRYMLGAILSQAFERPLPIVEANSQRVLARWFGQLAELDSAPVKTWLWKVAAECVPQIRPGDFNQAIMELGALICLPRAPRCDQCPVRTWCSAHEQNLQETIPLRRVAAKPTEMTEVAIIIHREGKYLFVQRPEGVRWQQMWEFPRVEFAPGMMPHAAAEQLLGTLGIEATLAASLSELRYTVTRYQVTLTPVEAEYRAGEFVIGYYGRGEWLEPSAFDDYPTSVTQRRLTRHLTGATRQRRLF